MKLLKKYVMCLIISNILFANASMSSKLIIGSIAKAGLWCNFFSALNHLVWCEKNNVMPVIYWDEDCLYYEKAGYNGSYNVWEYYFEPVSSETYQRGEPIRKHTTSPPDQNYGLALIDWFPDFTRERSYRMKVNDIINKYIKIKSNIAEKVESFYLKNIFEKQTIGIHIRGTDKFTETKPINPTVIFEKANKIAALIPHCQFFVATDEQSILEDAKKKLNGNVIYFDSYRSQDGRPIHFNTHAYSKAKLGEEVLIEVLLLSRCNNFLHTLSHVSSAVLYFNPFLKNYLFRSEKEEPLSQVIEMQANNEKNKIDLFWWTH